MNRRQARMLALLICADDIERGAEIGEYSDHPHCDYVFTLDEREKIKREALLVAESLRAQAERLREQNKPSPSE